MKSLILDGNSLTIDDVSYASGHPVPVSFSPASRKRMLASRRVVDEWVRKGEIVYGVTTGFGEFSNVTIDSADIEKLQENLIMSHSAGAGPPLPLEVVRAMMLLRMNALAKGFSGIRPETMEFLRSFFNSGVAPVIPSRGSVGSSGDLVQLSHLVLTMMGKGKVVFRRNIMTAAAALKELNMKPLKLAAKEGLALINGTQMMTAFAALVVAEAVRLSKLADIAAAMSVEALKGSDTAFDPRIQNLRPHRGQRECAANLRALMAKSEIRES
ncbi:MAG TPA: aromatic amino acid ammonia-lyase, partial [Bacteroidota bacterium]|nr:aromatic amino acid ammonia-lyase [Bacteroidota bacterium]